MLRQFDVVLQGTYVIKHFYAVFVLWEMTEFGSIRRKVKSRITRKRFCYPMKRDIGRYCNMAD